MENGVFFRIEKNKNYTVMSNHHLKNSNLSLKAKGLMSMILSLPNDWDFSKKGLAAIVKEGRTALENTLEELKAEGYLKIVQERSKGKFVYVYYIYEIPLSEEPCTENPCTENQPQSNTNKLSTNKQNTKNNNTTNVVLSKCSKQTYGNEEINAAFDEWERIFGYKQKQSKQNRFAVYNMLRAKDKGAKWLSDTMRILHEAQKDKFAGNYILGIAGFADLQQRYDSVWKWGSNRYAQTQEAQKSIYI